MSLHSERGELAGGPDDPGCVHWWMLARPDDDARVEARCKRCGERRTFDGGGISRTDGHVGLVAARDKWTRGKRTPIPGLSPYQAAPELGGGGGSATPVARLSRDCPQPILAQVPHPDDSKPASPGAMVTTSTESLKLLAITSSNVPPKPPSRAQ